jgi:ABC-2 type transport system permease protein
MIDDIRTVMWKERLEQSEQGESLRDRIAGFVMPLVGLGFMAVMLPLAFKTAWATTPAALTLSFLIPMMAVGVGIVDTFVGERERRTLEPLLATRLPDHAILFGKMGVIVALSMKFTLGMQVISLLVLNLSHREHAPMLPTLPLLAAIVAVALLASIVLASIGVLVSLRAETIKQATQRMMAAITAPGIACILGLYLAAKVLPASWREVFERFLHEQFATANFTQITLTVIAVLLLLSVVLLLTAMARFRRHRLIEM